MKDFRILLFQRALYNYQAVMYLEKEISISFFIITISASNLYMPMIWSYVILLDFLIPFLCGPDLQCIESWPLPFLRNFSDVGVLCTFSNIQTAAAVGVAGSSQQSNTLPGQAV